MCGSESEPHASGGGAPANAHWRTVGVSPLVACAQLRSTSGLTPANAHRSPVAIWASHLLLIWRRLSLRRRVRAYCPPPRACVLLRSLGR
jgi:hypothetical protein